MKKFKDWLENKRCNELYYKELEKIEEEIEKAYNHNKHLIDINLFLCEAVIEPEKIKIRKMMR